MVIIICGAGAAKGNGIFYGKDIGKGGNVTERLKAQMPAAQILMYMVSSTSHQHLSR